MKKITFVLSLLLSSGTLIGQTLNQAANWPNNSWTLSGSYDATYLIENPTTSSSSFSFNDDQPGSASVNVIAVESPIIDLTAAFNAGETSLTVNASYVFNIYQTEELTIEYYDASSGTWNNWQSALDETNGAPNGDFCSGNFENINSLPLQIQSFNTTQLTGFKYRIVYDDLNSWGWGFCFSSPTIVSQTPASCPPVGNLNITNVSSDAAEVFWTPGNIETLWEVVVQPQGSGVPSGSGTTTSENSPFVLNGLTDNTSYEVYVRADCGGGDFSTWVGPSSFTTLAIARLNFIQQATTVPAAGYDLAVVDMDEDYLDDIVTIVSNTSVNIHYQQPDGSFNSVDITTPSANFMPTWSLAAADLDRNGRTDLLYGNGSGVTFMKSNASGTGFTEISGSQYVFSQRSNFVDINNDGHLDAFVCHDVEPNVYYINDGDGNLTYVQGGLGDYASGGNYGSIWIDYDNDRDVDMFIAKCGGETARRTNQMHRNNADGTFTEVGASIGLADPMQTWSSAWGDFDNDGDMDVFVGASSGSHKLMENDNGIFADVTSGAGISGSTGIENITYDFDNDGYLDILCNGTILYGKGDLTFEDADNTQLSGANGSFGDLNNDGFIDAYFNGTIYRNAGNANNWVTINTVGTASNIDGIGARVELYTSAGTQIRDVRSGEGFRYMSTLNTHFGLGSETTIDNIVIYWPSGIIDNIVNPGINQVHTIVEGATLTQTDLALNDLVIHPNPVKNELKITTATNLDLYVATLFDVNGKLVFSTKIASNRVDVSFLNSGVYLLRLEANGKSVTKKFIKE